MQFNEAFAEQAMAVFIGVMVFRPLVMAYRTKYGELKYKEGLWDQEFVNELMVAEDISLRCLHEMPWVWDMIDEMCNLRFKLNETWFLVYTDRDNCEKYVVVWTSLQKR